MFRISEKYFPTLTSDDLTYSVTSADQNVIAFISGMSLKVYTVNGFAGDVTITLTASDGESEVSSLCIVNLEITGYKNLQQNAGLICYPNPVSSGPLHIRFSAPGNGEVKLRIFSIDGKEVSHYTFNRETSLFNAEINVAGLRSGHYLMEVSYQDQRMTYPFTKQ